MTRRARHTPEQIVRKLRKAEELAAEGKSADEIARALNVVSDQRKSVLAINEFRVGDLILSGAL